MNRKHGLSKTRLHSIWTNMKTRCNNPNATGFQNWGGKGIKVCEEWSNDVQAFYDWSMMNGYEEHLTIDRIDNDKGYSPDNCRWITYKDQANNVSTNHPYTFNGEVLNSKEMAEKYGLKRTTFEERLKSGWSLEKALLTPVRGCC